MKYIFISCIIVCTLFSCNRKSEKKVEQLTIEQQQTADTSGISTQTDLTSSPNTVLVTGMDRFRLIPIYKIKSSSNRNIEYSESSSYNGYNEIEEDESRYFMPGMDIIYGYNLINVAHYDVEEGKLSYFFEKPVLIRTLYFPGVKADSLMKKPITRDYFIVSVYDEDSNNDSLINNKDMRKLYHIDKANTTKTALLPKGYSALRSTYDYKNDMMYIYARNDANKNGTPEKEEPIAIFCLKLSNPTNIKQML